MTTVNNSNNNITMTTSLTSLSPTTITTAMVAMMTMTAACLSSSITRKWWTVERRARMTTRRGKFVEAERRSRRISCISSSERSTRRSTRTCLLARSWRSGWTLARHEFRLAYSPYHCDMTWRIGDGLLVRPTGDQEVECGSSLPFRRHIWTTCSRTHAHTHTHCHQHRFIVYYARRQQNHTDRTPKTQNYTTVHTNKNDKNTTKTNNHRLTLCVNAVLAVGRCPSVCPSVRLSHSCIVSKRLKTSRIFSWPDSPSF